MRVGLVLSTTFHAALLGYGLLALSAPHALEVADVEAFPVDIVPVESISQIQQGERQAPAAERAAPVPTTRPDEVADARNVGDNAVDTDSAPAAQAKPREVKAAGAPPPSSEPAKKPVQEPDETESKAEARPVPATEPTPLPQPKQEVAPDPTEQAAVAENVEAEAVRLPATMPAPQARPQPPQAQTAKSPERQNAEEPARKQAERSRSEQSQFDEDEVAALLNREEAAGGGARRSTEQAALGGRKTTEGTKLTQSEMDALRGQIEQCWLRNVDASAYPDLKVSIQFNLSPSGELNGRPNVAESNVPAPIKRALEGELLRAIAKCSPYQLPIAKYETWAEVIVNFHPSEIY